MFPLGSPCEIVDVSGNSKLAIGLVEVNKYTFCIPFIKYKTILTDERLFGLHFPLDKTETEKKKNLDQKCY